MSSLAATQADGYYIPPAYIDNTKPGRRPPSKNQVAAAATTGGGSNRGHNQFTQRGVVRFELPYSGICQQCEHYIGRGTRFNAQKTKAGNYLTTTIWQFEMTCRNCQTQVFLIQTDPQAYGFKYVQGITKLEHKETSTSTPFHSNATEISSMTENASSLERLERVAHGQRTVLSEHDELQALQTWNAKTFLNDADSNAQVRSTFRKERQARQRRLRAAKEKGWIKPGMELLDADDHDGDSLQQQQQQQQLLSRSVMRFGPTVTQQQQTRYRQVQTSSIFTKPPAVDGAANKNRQKRKTSVISTTSLPPSSPKPADYPDVPGSSEVLPTTAASKVLVSNQLHPSKRRRIAVVVAHGTTTLGAKNVQRPQVTFATTNPDHRDHHRDDDQKNKNELRQPSSTAKTTTSLLPLVAYSSSDDDDDDDGDNDDAE